MKEINIDNCATFADAVDCALKKVNEPSFFMFNECRIEITNKTTEAEIKKQYNDYFDERRKIKQKKRRDAIRTILIMCNPLLTFEDVKESLLVLGISQCEIDSAIEMER